MTTTDRVPHAGITLAPAAPNERVHVALDRRNVGVLEDCGGAIELSLQMQKSIFVLKCQFQAHKNVIISGIALTCAKRPEKRFKQSIHIHMGPSC